MVAKIASGKSLWGVLNYNENKVKNSEAELLMASSFPRDPTELSFRNKLERFQKLTTQNERSQKNVMHISLNFSRQDTLDNERLKSIATDYMNRIGFGNQPFLLYRHYDAAHPHVHVVTVNIENGGNRIETFNIGKNQSEKARKEIELSYGLIKAEDQKKEMAYLLKPVKLEKVIHGKSEIKASISSIVREVTDSYKFSSLSELNAVLRQFNVIAQPGAEGSRMREKGGLVYCLLNKHGDTAGIPIKASSIFGSPTLKNLKKKWQLNKESKKPYGLRLKHLLDKALTESRDLDDLQIRLQRQGIRIQMLKNINERVFGVTFIDNATRVVFKGSSLGKGYAADAFMEKITRVEAVKTTEISSLSRSMEKIIEPDSTANTAYPAGDQPVIVRLFDILMSGQYSEVQPDPFRRKKKKRMQAEQT